MKDLRQTACNTPFAEGGVLWQKKRVSLRGLEDDLPGEDPPHSNNPHPQKENHQERGGSGGEKAERKTKEGARDAQVRMIESGTIAPVYKHVLVNGCNCDCASVAPWAAIASAETRDIQKMLR